MPLVYDEQVTWCSWCKDLPNKTNSLTISQEFPLCFVFDHFDRTPFAFTPLFPPGFLSSIVFFLFSSLASFFPSSSNFWLARLTALRRIGLNGCPVSQGSRGRPFPLPPTMASEISISFCFFCQRAKSSHSPPSNAANIRGNSPRRCRGEWYSRISPRSTTTKRSSKRSRDRSNRRCRLKDCYILGIPQSF